jgi:hypothetical protein
MMTIRMHTSSVRLQDAGYSIAEEGELYEQSLHDIIEHTREYLDQLDYMRTFKVRWKDYSNSRPTVPLRMVTKPSIRRKSDDIARDL